VQVKDAAREAVTREYANAIASFEAGLLTLGD
jgi:hypothetical protein